MSLKPKQTVPTTVDARKPIFGEKRETENYRRKERQRLSLVYSLSLSLYLPSRFRIWFPFLSLALPYRRAICRGEALLLPSSVLLAIEATTRRCARARTPINLQIGSGKLSGPAPRQPDRRFTCSWIITPGVCALCK